MMHLSVMPHSLQRCCVCTAFSCDPRSNDLRKVLLFCLYSEMHSSLFQEITASALVLKPRPFFLHTPPCNNRLLCILMNKYKWNAYSFSVWRAEETINVVTLVIIIPLNSCSFINCYTHSTVRNINAKTITVLGDFLTYKCWSTCLFVIKTHLSKR